MEDIKKAIEEEAKKEAWNHGEATVGDPYVKYQADCGFRAGASFATDFILSKWEESERWRKVEEELEVCSNIIMRQKTEYGMHYSLFTNITQQIIDIVTKEYNEWKPIH